MTSQRSPFRLNKAEGKLMGVCAGLADHFEIDLALVRVAALLALALTFPLVGVAYLVVALIAKPRGARAGRGRDFDAAGASRERMSDLDARLRSVESYVTAPNPGLAREIDALR